MLASCSERVYPWYHFLMFISYREFSSRDSENLIDNDDMHLSGYRLVTKHKHPSKTFTEGNTVDLFIFLVLDEVQVGLRSD